MIEGDNVASAKMASTTVTTTDLSDKKREALAVLGKLRLDLTKHNLQPNQRDALLAEFKVFTRGIDSKTPWFASEDIEVVLKYAVDDCVLSTSREALRCLANIMLLQPSSRQMVADSGFMERLAERYKTDNRDDEFLLSRIIFLLTYDTQFDLKKLIRDHQIIESININVARHSKRYSKSSGRRPSVTSPLDDMAFIETLKLIFNITHFHPEVTEEFSKSIPHLLKVLHRHRIPNPPLQQPVNYLINALLNLHSEDPKKRHFSINPLFPTFNQEANVEHIIKLLDRSIDSYREEELDQLAGPLVAFIRRVYELAPPDVRRYIEWMLLPTEEDRSKPLGQGDSLPSRLLRASTSPSLPTLRESISAMLYELSGKDAEMFVRNVGFGFASGFLFGKNIPIPASAKEAWSTEEDAGGTAGSFMVNPVTGQRMDAEPKDNLPPMTAEEKEREAERLFVLFERLKKTGVIDVTNPVQQAINEGRFEELSDDEGPDD